MAHLYFDKIWIDWLSKV